MELEVKNHLLMHESKRHGFGSWVGKIPWRRAWQPTPVFLPRESHGQRSLVGYSPWGHKESEMTKQLNDNNKCLRLLNVQVLCLSLESVVILSMGFSWQEYWNGFPFPPLVDHVLSEVSTMSHPSWVASTA